MAQTPDEKTCVEIPFIEQLKGRDWDHIKDDIDVYSILRIGRASAGSGTSYR